MSSVPPRLRRNPLVRGALRAVRRRLRAREAMRFPSFDAEAHRLALGDADYFRLATLALALRAVDRDEISGALAEVGVYRGDTSVFLDAVSPSRTLYLFDTFEGFPDADLASGQADDLRFRDTSAEAVRRGSTIGPSFGCGPAGCPRRSPGSSRSASPSCCSTSTSTSPPAPASSSSTPGCRRAVAWRCTTTTTRSPTGPADGRSTASWPTSPSASSSSLTSWAPAMLRRV